METDIFNLTVKIAYPELKYLKEKFKIFERN